MAGDRAPSGRVDENRVCSYDQLPPEDPSRPIQDVPPNPRASPAQRFPFAARTDDSSNLDSHHQAGRKRPSFVRMQQSVVAERCA